jgi:hypothetical protein
MKLLVSLVQNVTATREGRNFCESLIDTCVTETVAWVTAEEPVKLLKFDVQSCLLGYTAV